MPRRSAFTLIEMLVVVMIIGLFAGPGVVRALEGPHFPLRTIADLLGVGVLALVAEDRAPGHHAELRELGQGVDKTFGDAVAQVFGVRVSPGIGQRQDRERAQKAYISAKARVAALIDRYGETAVLGWLVRGLPADVRNSSASKAATNSR